MEYIDEGMFPGLSGAFPMTKNNIDKSALQEMMSDGNVSFNLAKIKNVFEMILGENIEDCSKEIRSAIADDKKSLKGILKDYQKALNMSKKMTTQEFFDAKIQAQRNNILRGISNVESVLRYPMSSAQREKYSTQLGYYRQDLELWDTLLPDEKLFFVIKSMADFEKKNGTYYKYTYESESNMRSAMTSPEPYLEGGM